MNRFLVILILIFSGGCSIVGEKNVLVVQNSEWETRKLFSKVTYQFQCNKLWIDLEEIVFERKISSYGPIVPIIPSGKSNDNSENNLELRFKIVGKVDSNSYDEQDFLVNLKQEKGKIIPFLTRSFYKLNEESFEKKHWIQYQLSYIFPNKLRDIKELYIEIDFPFEKCKPAPIHLKRESVSNNDFILGPGI